ncbi:MAG: PHP domain-containing protein [Christensenellaceae bacterium]|nr:PHP domain-containing protein [Christensenellaceae bacterium]
MTSPGNYRITADLHTHTVFSHGLHTPEDNIKAALSRGLSAIAITDHSVGHISYGVRDLSGYFAEIARLKEAYADRIRVLAGLELNITSLQGHMDLPKEAEAHLDLCIMGFHKFTNARRLPDWWHFYLARKKTDEQTVRKTTDAYIKAISSGKLTILAHPSYAIAIDVAEVACACREYGTLFEINNSHPQLSEEMLETAAKTGTRFVLSSDAHQADKVGVMDSALAKALNVGLGEREIVNLSKNDR